MERPGAGLPGDRELTGVGAEPDQVADLEIAAAGAGQGDRPGGESVPACRFPKPASRATEAPGKQLRAGSRRGQLVGEVTDRRR